MAKKLSDFSVEIMLEGWFIRNYGTFHKGQKFVGADINERMILALMNKETYTDAQTGNQKPVLSLSGGTVEELKATLSSAPKTSAVVEEPKQEEKPKEEIKTEDVSTQPIVDRKRRPRDR